MKKTAFDKIVVGFVVLVVIIFALLMVYSISTAQNSVLSERKSTMKNEITMLADGAMTDYSNGTIDSKELYKELQHAADTLDMGIWLTDERSNIISGREALQEAVNPVDLPRIQIHTAAQMTISRIMWNRMNCLHHSASRIHLAAISRRTLW